MDPARSHHSLTPFNSSDDTRRASSLMRAAATVGGLTSGAVRLYTDHRSTIRSGSVAWAKRATGRFNRAGDRAASVPPNPCGPRIHTWWASHRPSPVAGSTRQVSWSGSAPPSELCPSRIGECACGFELGTASSGSTKATDPDMTSFDPAMSDMRLSPLTFSRVLRRPLGAWALS